LDTSLVRLSHGGEAEPHAKTARTGMTHEAFHGVRHGLARFRVEDAHRLKRELFGISG
jgi:hypothetical protein